MLGSALRQEVKIDNARFLPLLSCHRLVFHFGRQFLRV